MTQLYLISPPQIELAAFAKQLEAALSTSVETRTSLSPWERAGVRANNERSENGPHPNPLPEEEGNAFVGAFQLRLKHADDAEITAAIKELMPICRAHECAFIINDRVDLCLEFACDGVHVGQEDLQHYPSPSGRGTKGEGKNSANTRPLPNPPPEGEGVIAAIRAQLAEDMALGITCHASKHLAMEAAEAGADYVAFGAFYPTTSKPKEKLEKWGTPTLDLIEWWTTYTEIPCVAIGGITPENCRPLVDAGTDFIAVITSVWEHAGGPGAAVKEFYTAYTNTN